MNQMEKGVFQIINNEGQICYVNTVKKDSKTYGKTWEDICRSVLNGNALEGVIDRFQYRTHEGKKTSEKPTGMVVKINGEEEVFLPFSLSGSYRNSLDDSIGERIVVMVESFDPMNLQVVVREIKIAETDFDINNINKQCKQHI